MISFVAVAADQATNDKPITTPKMLLMMMGNYFNETSVATSDRPTIGIRE